MIIIRVSPCGVLANVVNCDITVNEFEKTSLAVAGKATSSTKSKFRLLIGRKMLFSETRGLFITTSARAIFSPPNLAPRYL